MKNDVITLNIAIIPDEEIKSKIIEVSNLVSSKIPTQFVLGKKRIPHITIYQAAFPAKNLDKVKKVVSDLAEKNAPFEITMKGISISHGTFLFWNCVKSDRLISLHEQAVNKANFLREGQIIKNLPIQSAEDKFDVENYGSLLIGPRFSPHITVTRISNPIDKAKAIQFAKVLGEETFKVKTIILGILGQHGTVREIISAFPFSG